MDSYQNHQFATTKSKYLKFKSRLQKCISSGRFENLPRRKKNSLIARVEKFGSRLEQMGFARKAAVAGTIAAGMAMPNLASAQNQGVFFRQTGSSLPLPITASTVDLSISDIDTDSELEILLATTDGGKILNGNPVDGWTSSAPENLSNMNSEFLVGDIDGDTHLDIVFRYNDDFLTSINDGDGNFGVPTNIGGEYAVVDFDLVDFDSDGDLDVVLGRNLTSSISYFANDGSGNFGVKQNLSINGNNPRQIEFADMDNDGDKDLIVADYYFSSPSYARVRIFENTTDGPGAPTLEFTNPAHTFSGPNYENLDNLTTLDFDGDGDLDLFFTQYADYQYFALQNQYVEGTPMGFLDVGAVNQGGSTEINDVVVSDFDNDGDEDMIVVGDTYNYFVSFNGSSLDSDNGDLSSDRGNVGNTFDQADLGDLDGDGHLDFVGIGSVGSYVYLDVSGPQSTAISINEFSERTATANATLGRFIAFDKDGNDIGTTDGGTVFSFITGDGTNDADNSKFNITGVADMASLEVGAADLDVSQTTYRILINAEASGVNRVYPFELHLQNSPETGFGTLFSGEPTSPTSNIEKGISGDFDGDGVEDLIYQESTNDIFVSEQSELPVYITNGNLRAVSDVDGDGDLDFIISNSGDVEIWLNGAIGVASNYSQTIGAFVYDVGIGDFNNDGINDLAVASAGGNEIWVNNGDQTFSYLTELSSSLNDHVEVGDVDNDGQTDVIIADRATMRVYTNDDGSFSQVASFVYSGGRDLIVSDFDNDGDLDIAKPTSGAVVIYDGDGLGGFNRSYDRTSRIYGATFGDLDGDQDLDLVYLQANFSSSSENSVIVALNDGNNVFTEQQNLPVSKDSFNDLILLDLDGDDDLDLISSVDGELINHTNQNIAPYLTGLTGRRIQDEGTLSGKDLGQLTITDLNGDTPGPIVFSDGDNDNGLFIMDGTGNLTLNTDLDWETLGSELVIDVAVSDDQGNSRVETTSIKINNLPELGQGTFSSDGVPLFGLQSPIHFIAGDYDLDGDQDLIRSTFIYSGGRDIIDPKKEGEPSGDSQISNSVFQQNSGSFSESPMYAGGNSKYLNMIFIDYDNDGDLDVLGESSYGPSSRLVISTNNNGMFNDDRLIGFDTKYTSAENLISGDFDGDGLIEVVVHTSRFSSKYDDTEFVNVLEIDAGGEFSYSQSMEMYNEGSPVGLLESVGYLQDIAVADFNSDGFDDLFAATEGGDVIFYGSASGFSYSYTTVITTDDHGVNSVRTGDVNGDGLIDILMEREDGSRNAELDIHLNNGSGFTLDQTFSIGIGGEKTDVVGLADLDGNGSPDLITIGLATTDPEDRFDMNIYQNDGSGTFTLFQTITDVGGEGFQFMDVDGDDDLDIVVNKFENKYDNVPSLKAFINENVAPSAVNLSATTIDEHLALNTEVATISIDDLNPGDTHVTALVTGDGSNDLHNSYFNVSGNSLQVVKDISFEATPQLNIYFSVYDGHQTYNQAIVLDVNDVDQVPTAIALSANAFDEGTSPGTSIAGLSATDINVGDTHVFELVAGDGTNDADNSSFSIQGDQLVILEDSRFEDKPSYNIYLSVIDDDGSFEQAFVITVNDINQAPTAIALSNSSLDEKTSPGTTIATISVTDVNTTDTHNLSLVSGDGTNDAHNSSFVISGNNLILIGEVNFDNSATLNVFIEADDGENSFQQAFTLTVNDVLGLEDETANSLGIYPNPGQDRIEINLNNDLMGRMDIQISDLTGRVIHRMQSEKNSSLWKERIDMTSAQPGVYIIEISFEKRSFVQRWIKE